MNFHAIKRNNAEPDGQIVQSLAESFGMNPRLMELLFSRGIDTQEKIRNYLYPDVKNLYDPFSMKGMKEATDRLKDAIAQKQKIVIYGDYDADGICATAILSLYLRLADWTCMHIFPTE